MEYNLVTREVEIGDNWDNIVVHAFDAWWDSCRVDYIINKEKFYAFRY